MGSLVGTHHPHAGNEFPIWVLDVGDAGASLVPALGVGAPILSVVIILLIFRMYLIPVFVEIVVHILSLAY